jgi:hypothetical protein
MREGMGEREKKEKEDNDWDNFSYTTISPLQVF